MIYVYKCDDCDLEVDRYFRLGKQTTTVPCPECGKEMRRKFTPLNAIYKGVGWGGHPDRDERAKQPGPLNFDDKHEEIDG